MRAVQKMSSTANVVTFNSLTPPLYKLCTYLSTAIVEKIRGRRKNCDASKTSRRSHEKIFLQTRLRTFACNAIHLACTDSSAAAIFNGKRAFTLAEICDPFIANLTTPAGTVPESEVRLIMAVEVSLSLITEKVTASI